MGGFDNAKMVKINNKEVESIKTNDGGIIYQRPMIATIIGDEIYLGHDNSQWLIANGDVKVDFGTGRQYTIDTTKQIYFGYTNQGDGLSSHDITFFGIITGLGEGCFEDCTSLTNIIIPLSVTSLGKYCFSGCTSLTSVTIPSSVTTLGNYCFYRCSSLNTYQLYWTSNNIIAYDSNKMLNNTNTKFYVPKGQKTNYVNKGYPSAKVIERS